MTIKISKTVKTLVNKVLNFDKTKHNSQSDWQTKLLTKSPSTNTRQDTQIKSNTFFTIIRKDKAKANLNSLTHNRSFFKITKIRQGLKQPFSPRSKLSQKHFFTIIRKEKAKTNFKPLPIIGHESNFSKIRHHTSPNKVHPRTPHNEITPPPPEHSQRRHHPLNHPSITP